MGRAAGWGPRDRRGGLAGGHPGLGATRHRGAHGEMPTDVPTSNGCLGNSDSSLGSTGHPKQLPLLLAALTSSTSVGGSGPALVMAARRPEEAIKQKEKTVMAAPRL